MYMCLFIYYVTLSDGKTQDGKQIKKIFIPPLVLLAGFHYSYIQKLLKA